MSDWRDYADSAQRILTADQIEAFVAAKSAVVKWDQENPDELFYAGAVYGACKVLQALKDEPDQASSGGR